MSEIIEENGVKISKNDDTFFNPAQKLNRDLTIAVIQNLYGEQSTVKILGAMSATGLREIRCLKEIPNSQVFINDISPAAVETIRKNLDFNGFTNYRVLAESDSLRNSTSAINITQSDCISLMRRHKGCFDVVDIDPFGTSVPFLESALLSVRHKGIVCFTCTDKASLCSKEARCYARYGSQIKRVFAKNETPVRVLLSAISRVAAQLDYSIEPIVSLSVDFYVRVIVRVVKGRGLRVIEQNSHLFICNCMFYRIQGLKEPLDSTCPACAQNMRLYGPFWSQKLYDEEVLGRLYSSLVKKEEENERLVGILRLMMQELAFPFYYEMPVLASLFKVNGCKVRDLMNGLANKSYSVSLVYYDSNAIKTDAPITVIQELMVARDKGNRESVDFSENPRVSEIFAGQFYRGIIMSGMKPGTLPKREEKRE